MQPKYLDTIFFSVHKFIRSWSFNNSKSYICIFGVKIQFHESYQIYEAFDQTLINPEVEFNSSAAQLQRIL